MCHDEVGLCACIVDSILDVMVDTVGRVFNKKESLCFGLLRLLHLYLE